MSNVVALKRRTWLTYAEVMELTKLSRRTIQTWVAEGKFPRPHKIGQAARWVEADLLNWMMLVEDGKAPGFEVDRNVSR